MEFVFAAYFCSRMVVPSMRAFSLQCVKGLGTEAGTLEVENYSVTDVNRPSRCHGFAPLRATGAARRLASSWVI